MPQEKSDSVGAPDRALISIPLSGIDTDDLAAMRDNLTTLINHASWPMNDQEFRRARKAIQTELLSRSA